MSEAQSTFEALEDLGKTHPGKGRYAPMDRYRDFRQVFLATEQGRRVLWEILDMGHMTAVPCVLAGFDTNRTNFFGGRQALAIDIFKAVHIEPTEPPKRQVRDTSR